MELLFVMIILIVAIGAIPFVRGIWRGFHTTPKSSPHRQSNQGPAVTAMAKPTRREFTFEYEAGLAKAQQRVWIQYEDFSGNETDRKIELYCPKEDDEYLLAWCCWKQEPRTFNRNKIIAWQILDEFYTFNPLVEQDFREEGSR